MNHEIPECVKGKGSLDDQPVSLHHHHQFRDVVSMTQVDEGTTQISLEN